MTTARIDRRYWKLTQPRSAVFGALVFRVALIEAPHHPLHETQMFVLLVADARPHRCYCNDGLLSALNG